MTLNLLVAMGMITVAYGLFYKTYNEPVFAVCLVTLAVLGVVQSVVKELKELQNAGRK
jgi:hypothetical protein